MPTRGQPCTLRRYDNDDDFRSVLSNLAQRWEESGAEMAIHLPDRRLRTGTDFGILLEQAPHALYELQARRPTTLSLYEQTAMLELDLVPLQESTKTRLTSRPWSNAPPCSWELESTVVLEDLRDAIAVVRACLEGSQNTLATDWLNEWLGPPAE
jgi:hypothetical protein